MVDNCVSISADLHLEKTLDALKLKEDGEQKLLAENKGLKAELHQVRNTSELLADENRQLKSVQQQLCGQMDELKHVNEDLKRENIQLQQKHMGISTTGSTGNDDGSRSNCQRCADIDRELAKLKATNNELRYINDQWDKDYREHEEVFRRFREDSHRAQSENESFIATLKESKEQLLEQMRDLRFELDRSRKEVQRLQQQQHVAGHPNGVNPRRLKDLEEENTFLRTQLKTFQDDFDAERRDRERMSEEKQSAALRFEAEITSLKLQLDRCRNELVHYTTEATRLAQQLRLKNQYEEDQFKKHLESQGYIPRSPNSALPPLDPYVENDPPPSTHGAHLAPPIKSSSTLNGMGPSGGRRLAPGKFLARSAENVSSRSAPTTSEQRHLSPPTVQRKSHPPSPTYVNIHNHQYQPQMPVVPATSNGYIMQNGHIATNALPVTNQKFQQPNRHQQQQPIQQHAPAVVNATPVPYMNGYIDGHLPTNAPQLVAADALRTDRYGYPANFQQLVVGGSGQAAQQAPVAIPRVESKGKYSCPRCARRFNYKTDCNDHKARCMS